MKKPKTEEYIDTQYENTRANSCFIATRKYDSYNIQNSDSNEK